MSKAVRQRSPIFTRALSTNPAETKNVRPKTRQKSRRALTFSPQTAQNNMPRAKNNAAKSGPKTAKAVHGSALIASQRRPNSFVIFLFLSARFILAILHIGYPEFIPEPTRRSYVLIDRPDPFWSLAHS